MEIIAISTATSRHTNQHNGNLKTIFNSIVSDLDDCKVIINRQGTEQAIEIRNGCLVSKEVESSILNLFMVNFGIVPQVNYHPSS